MAVGSVAIVFYFSVRQRREKEGYFDDKQLGIYRPRICSISISEGGIIYELVRISIENESGLINLSWYHSELVTVQFGVNYAESLRWNLLSVSCSLDC